MTSRCAKLTPGLVQGLRGKRIVQIASGNQHSLALDEDGYVYAWGFAGYSRLGLEDQKDRCVRPAGVVDDATKARLVPTIIPAFTDARENRRGAAILCGPTSQLFTHTGTPA